MEVDNAAYGMQTARARSHLMLGNPFSSPSISHFDSALNWYMTVIIGPMKAGLTHCQKSNKCCNISSSETCDLGLPFANNMVFLDPICECGCLLGSLLCLG